MPKIGERYRHYKGTEYVVIALARHSETEEELVVYQDIEHPEKVWARPATMWLQTMTWDGGGVPRFTKLG